MSGARALRDVAAFALLIALLGNAQPQSTNVFKPEKRRATRSVGTQEQPVNLSGAFYLERSRDGFGIRSHGIIERTTSGPKFYPLPQSDVEAYRRLRSADLEYMRPHALTAKDYHGQEVIGPYQLEDSKIWFGNQYYDSEGERGVGAFGYFDMKSRKYVLFSPPEMARSETSALLVETDAIWLALDHFGEDISRSPGGIMRWDRHDHHVRHYPLEFVIHQIQRDRKDPVTLRLATHGGYALLRNGAIQRFRIQKSSTGEEQLVHINQFPPPPSIH